MKVKGKNGKWKKVHEISGHEEQRSPIEELKRDQQIMFEVLLDVLGVW